MKIKHLVVGTAIIVSAFAGDYFDLNDRIVNPIRYRDVEIDEKSCKKPFQLKKRYIINKDNKLETYIGYDEKWYKVEKGIRVNERTLAEMLKEECEKIRPYIDMKIEDLIEFYKKWEL